MRRSSVIALLGLGTGILFDRAITSCPDCWIPFSILLLITLCSVAICNRKHHKLKEDLDNALCVIGDLVKVDVTA